MKNPSRFLIAFAFLALALSAPAQTLDQVAAEREGQLDDALARLHALRETIQSERQPLARELNQLNAQTAELESELVRARRIRDNKSVELTTLQSQTDARQREIDYVARTLIPTFVANFDAALSPAERAGAGETIREYNLFLENPEAGEVEKLEHGLALLGNAIEELDNNFGGRQIQGEALDPDGNIHSGHFLQLGPLVYFLSENQELAAIADSTSADLPTLFELPASAATSLTELLNSGTGTLPLDPTLGDALAMEGTRDSIGEHLDKGGVWVYPILLFALAATLVAVIKSIQVFRIRHPEPMIIHEIVKDLRAGNYKAALDRAQKQPEPAREMLTAAVEHADESIEMVEEVMYESMLTTQPRLERFLNVIAVTAAAAPLLGLLGTVTGIIKTFRLMTVFGAGDPKPLISGISEALITTELGLILAIPALILHAMLARKVAGTMARLEKTAVTFVNGLARSQPQKGVAP